LKKILKPGAKREREREKERERERDLEILALQLFSKGRKLGSGHLGRRLHSERLPL